VCLYVWLCVFVGVLSFFLTMDLCLSGCLFVYHYTCVSKQVFGFFHVCLFDTHSCLCRYLRRCQVGFCMFPCLSLCVWPYVSVGVFVSLPLSHCACVFEQLFTCMSNYACVSEWVCVCFCVYLWVFVCLTLCVCWYFLSLSLCLCVRAAVYLSLSLCLCVWVGVCLFLCLSLCVCLSESVSFCRCLSLCPCVWVAADICFSFSLSLSLFLHVPVFTCLCVLLSVWNFGKSPVNHSQILLFFLWAYY